MFWFGFGFFFFFFFFWGGGGEGLVCLFYFLSFSRFVSLFCLRHSLGHQRRPCQSDKFCNEKQVDRKVLVSQYCGLFCFLFFCCFFFCFFFPPKFHTPKFLIQLDTDKFVLAIPRIRQNISMTNSLNLIGCEIFDTLLEWITCILSYPSE